MSDTLSIVRTAIEIIGKHFTVPRLGVPQPPKEVFLDQQFERDLQADSLDMLELAIELEDAFDIDMVEAPLTIASTVKDMVRYVECAVKAKAA